MKSAAQRAATAALLAASPLAAGISGEHWSRCRITHGNPLLADEFLIKRFWGTSEQIVAAMRAAHRIAPQAPARNNAVSDRQSPKTRAGYPFRAYSKADARRTTISRYDR
jgi:hypothetical protein